MYEQTKRRLGARLAIGAAALAASLFCADHVLGLSYSASPISATVIDAETRQPLGDVIVLVVWALENSNGGGGPFWIYEETVSNKDGRFEFAGWGPTKVPQDRGDPPWRLSTEQPIMYLFKSGYPFRSVSNEWESWMLGNRTWTGDPVRSSMWNNKSIELRRFQGTEQEYLNSLSMTAGRLPLQECKWAKFPRLTAALVRERGDRVPPYKSNSLPTMKSLQEKAADQPGCAPPSEVLGPFLK
jgi:hypothetical protein